MKVRVIALGKTQVERMDGRVYHLATELVSVVNNEGLITGALDDLEDLLRQPGYGLKREAWYDNDKLFKVVHE